MEIHLLSVEKQYNLCQLNKCMSQSTMVSLQRDKNLCEIQTGSPPTK